MIWRAFLGILCASFAHAEIKTFNTTSGDFDVETNWDPNGVPDDDDRIVIGASKTCTLTTSETVDSLDVAGTLILQAGGILTLENNDHHLHTCPPLSPSCNFSPDDSLVDGLLTIGGSTASPGKIVISDESHEFDGIGIIEGITTDTNGAIIEIASGLKLINQLDEIEGDGTGIRGSITIKRLTDGDGENRGILRNEGIVAVGAEFTFLDRMIIDAAIEDNSHAVWLSDCGTVIEFEFGSTSLQGDFTDDYLTYFNSFFARPGGTFEFHETMRTCGTYVRTGCGGIDLVGSGVTFQYASFSDEDTGCANPDTNGTSIIIPNICVSAEFFVIIADVTPEDDCD